MKLDLRQPLFVFRGAWNPAIFQPGWVARYLFEFPEGAPVEAGLVMTPGQPPLTFVRSIGVAATQESIMVYLQRYNEETKAEAEKVARNLFQVLPHTPFGPFGVNFQFREENPDDELYDKLKASDQIDAHFKVTSQSILTTIQLAPDVILNFKRSSHEGCIIYDFNFHHPKIGDASNLLNGLLDKYCAECEEITKTLYGVSYDGEILFDFPSTGGSKSDEKS